MRSFHRRRSHYLFPGAPGESAAPRDRVRTMLHAEAIGTTMKTTAQEGPASGSTVLLVLLSASVISCTGPTAPDAPEAPAVSAELARTSSPFSYSRTISSTTTGGHPPPWPLSP